jgi:uncharacterized membrane protein YsdA (DUF1294 family)
MVEPFLLINLYILENSADIILLLYLVLVNIIGAWMFARDKFLAVKGKARISEKSLHLIEFAGSAVSVLFLMYIIRHKNAKPSYYLITYFALLIWIILIVLFCRYSWFFTELLNFEL